jgi:hypothetical protein
MCRRDRFLEKVQRPAVALGDVARDRQAQSAAAVTVLRRPARGVTSEEAIEDPVAVLRGNPRSVISNIKDRAVGPCGERDADLVGGMADRVVEAEDRAEVLSTRESLHTQMGLHRRVLHTANTTPVEPDVLENKFYALGVGPVLELDLSPRFGRSVLVAVTHG